MPLTATGSVKKLVVQSDLCLTSPTCGIKLRLAETVCIVSHVINSLQCRRILGRRKLLVYVRIIVTAIFFFLSFFDFRESENSNPSGSHFLLSFGDSTWRFREQNVRAPEENACIAGYVINLNKMQNTALMRFLLSMFFRIIV